MRILILPLILLMTCSLAYGQSVSEEILDLRELLKLPASISIAPSTSALPNVSPLRVYIAADQNKKVQNSFVKRINEWNKKNGAKYGTLEIVQNLSEADVILAWRFTVVEDAVLDPPGPFICCPKRFFSYLILRKAEGLEILRRIVIEGYEDPAEIEHQGGTLRSDFFNRLKKRSKDK